MEISEAIFQNNKLMGEMLHELRSLNANLLRQDTDDCSAKEALALIGLNNERYLTYYFKLRVLNRRKGGSGFLYSKRECKELAEKFRNKTLVPPRIKDIYEML